MDLSNIEIINREKVIGSRSPPAISHKMVVFFHIYYVIYSAALDLPLGLFNLTTCILLKINRTSISAQFLFAILLRRPSQDVG